MIAKYSDILNCL